MAITGALLGLVLGVAACGAPPSAAPPPAPAASRPPSRPPGWPVPPLPPGALARCGSGPAALEGDVLAMHVGDDGAVQTVEDVGGRLVLRDAIAGGPGRHLGQGTHAAFSGDGSRVSWLDASGDAGAVVLHGTSSLGAAWQIAVQSTSGPAHRAWHLATSRSGGRLLVIDDDRRQALVIDGETGRIERTSALPPGRFADADADAGRILWARDRSSDVAIFDVVADRFVGEVEPPVGETLSALLLGERGESVLGVGASHVWRAPRRGGELATLALLPPGRSEADATIQQVARSAAGHHVLVERRRDVVLVGPGRGARLVPRPPPTADPAGLRLGVSNDGRVTAVAEGRTLVVDDPARPAPQMHAAPPEALGWLDRGELLASLGEDGLRLWRSRGCAHVAVLPHARLPLAVARDARRLAIGQEDGSLLLLDQRLRTLRRIRADRRTIVGAGLDAAATRLWVLVADGDPRRPAEEQPEDLVLGPGEERLFRIDLVSSAVAPVSTPWGVAQLSVGPRGEVLLHQRDRGWSLDDEHGNPIEKGHATDRAILTSEGVAMATSSSPWMLEALDVKDRWTFVRGAARAGAWDLNRRAGRLAVGLDTGVALFELTRGAPLGLLEVAGARAIAFAPDGARIAIAGPRGLHLFEPAPTAGPAAAERRVVDLPGVARAEHVAEVTARGAHVIVGGVVGELSFEDGQFRPERGQGATHLARTWRGTCAVEVGRARCWGHAGSGPFAWDPRGLGRHRQGPAVEETLLGGKATAVAVAGTLACGLEEGGRLVCLGAPGGMPEPPPAPVEVLGQVGAVAMGAVHACASRLDGTVACWGDNRYGQAIPGGDLVVRGPAPVPGVTGASSIAAGSHHTCALGRDGGVRCWGSRTFDAVGLRGAGPDGVAPIAGVERAVAIAAAARASCALRADGRPLCWGHLAGESLYEVTSLEPELGRVEELHLTDDAVCGRAGGHVRCVVPPR